MVGMIWLREVLGQLVASPRVALQVFGVLRVDSIELPLRGGVEHQWIDEEPRKAIESLVEGGMGDLEVEVGFLQRGVGIG
jgi:hypothetical protein